MSASDVRPEGTGREVVIDEGLLARSRRMVPWEVARTSEGQPVLVVIDPGGAHDARVCIPILNTETMAVLASAMTFADHALGSVAAFTMTPTVPTSREVAAAVCRDVLRTQIAEPDADETRELLQSALRVLRGQGSGPRDLRWAIFEIVFVGRSIQRKLKGDEKPLFSKRVIEKMRTTFIITRIREQYPSLPRITRKLVIDLLRSFENKRGRGHKAPVRRLAAWSALYGALGLGIAPRSLKTELTGFNTRLKGPVSKGTEE